MLLPRDASTAIFANGIYDSGLPAPRQMKNSNTLYDLNWHAGGMRRAG